MKLFTPFARAKQAQATDSFADIAQRLETVEGCHAYLSELKKIQTDQADQMENPKFCLENPKFCSLIRAWGYRLPSVAEGLRKQAGRIRLQTERKAAKLAIADSRNAAASAIKAAEKALAVANVRRANAAQASQAMQARMAPLSAQVAELRQLAAQRVQTAQANFDAVMTQANTDEAAELKASQTLIEAQQGMASSGAAECLRLEKLAQQLEALKEAEQAAAQFHHEAVVTLNQALAARALVEFDNASLQLLDAYFLTVEASKCLDTKVPGWSFPDAPSVWFNRSVHAMSHRGENWEGGGGLSPSQVGDMAQSLSPIDLKILAESVHVQITSAPSAGDSTPGDAESSDGGALTQAQRQVLHRGI